MLDCTTYKSVQIDFTPPAIAPAEGYRVKWRVAGYTAYTTISPNPTTSPIVIPQVPVCTNLEGTIEASCGNGNYGSPVAFVVGADSTASGGRGSITGTNSANCNGGATGTIVTTNAFSKIQLTTTYYSLTGTMQGATLTIREASSGNTVFTLVAPVSTVNTPNSVLTPTTLPAGSYTYTLTTVPCQSTGTNSGSGFTSFQLVNIQPS
jgi:hypothetical protein